VPKSLEQVEEEERRTEQENREQAKWERQEQAKQGREEKEQRAKQAKLEKFIAAHPVVSELLKEARMKRDHTGRWHPDRKINPEAYLNWIKEESRAKSEKGLLKACGEQLAYLQGIRRSRDEFRKKENEERIENIEI